MRRDDVKTPEQAVAEGYSYVIRNTVVLNHPLMGEIHVKHEFVRRGGVESSGFRWDTPEPWILLVEQPEDTRKFHPTHDAALEAALERWAAREIDDKQPARAPTEGIELPGGTYIAQDGHVRVTKTGDINNCQLASTGQEVSEEYGPCQICQGNCPDRTRLGQPE